MSEPLETLVDYLKSTYRNIDFAYGDRFKYRYPNKVFLEPLPNLAASTAEPLENPEKSTTPPEFFALQTLHELGHALCKHKNYQIDVERIKIEREAWEAAKTVYEKLPKSLKNTFEWDENYVEDSLDTYRDWLHKKSTCKTCGLTCYQTDDGEYHCPHCENFI